MISANASRRMVRSVALFEAAKGVLVLLGGFGLLSLLHRDLRALAAALVGRLHLDPSHHYASVFIEAAANTTDARLWFIACVAFVYSTFRFVEAYGLWFERRWAEWLAVVSGGAYIPIELYEVFEKFTWIRISALVVNVAVVVLIGSVLWQKRKRRKVAA
jgi:uncharacterized membrane protein (DUF2068 family)